MTLVEVMVSILVLGTTALASMSALLFSYRMADSNLRSIGAAAAAQSLAEQVLVLDYTTLSQDTWPIDLPSSAIGSVNVGEWNPRTDDIHNTPDESSDDLVMSFRPEIAQSDPSSGFLCSQVIIHYQWQEHSFFNERTREDSITIVVSNVPSY